MGKINIGWTSNSPSSPSGYGQQTKLFTDRILAAGHKVAIFANYGVAGAPFQTPEGIIVYPSVADSALNDVIFGHFQESRSEIVISLYDPHAYNPEIWKVFPWCAWAPVDSTPLLPANQHSLKAARWIWAMSRHGERMLHQAGFADRTTYVPHGIDTHVFAPRDRTAARAKLSGILGATLLDKFVIVMNSANKGAPSRKGFFEALAAYKVIADRYPDAMLYIHSEISGVFQGEHLPTIVTMLDIDAARILYAPQYQLVCGMIQPDYLADVYNAADVYLSGSHGEGFGIGQVEAQACGTPSIVPRNTAQTELCFTGKTVEGTTYMPVVGTTWERPNIQGLIEGLEWAYTERGNIALREETRQKALAYDADKVFADYMLPAIEKIQTELYALPEPKQILRKRQQIAEYSNGKIKQEIYTEIADAMRGATL